MSEWLDQVGVPDRPGEIEHAKKVTEQLLKDGTLERRVRTALLKVVRKNACELAKFRKGPRRFRLRRRVGTRQPDSAAMALPAC